MIQWLRSTHRCWRRPWRSRRPTPGGTSPTPQTISRTTAARSTVHRCSKNITRMFRFVAPHFRRIMLPSHINRCHVTADIIRCRCMHVAKSCRYNNSTPIISSHNVVPCCHTTLPYHQVFKPHCRTMLRSHITARIRRCWCCPDMFTVTPYYQATIPYHVAIPRYRTTVFSSHNVVP